MASKKGLVLMELFAGQTKSSMLNRILEKKILTHLPKLDVKKAYVGDYSRYADDKAEKVDFVAQAWNGKVFHSPFQRASANADLIFWFLGLGYLPQADRKDFLVDLVRHYSVGAEHCGTLIFTE